MNKSSSPSGLSIGFLMGVTYRRLSNLLQLRLKPYDITPEQWSVLYQIEQSQGMIQKEIAEKTGKDKTAITRILDHLETKGLIMKQLGKQDRRSYMVTSTDRGQYLIQETLPIEEGLNNEIIQIMSRAEYELFQNILYRINSYAHESFRN